MPQLVASWCVRRVCLCVRHFNLIRFCLLSHCRQVFSRMRHPITCYFHCTLYFFFALSTSFFVVFFCGTRFNTTFAWHKANKVWSKLRNACFPFAPEPPRHQAQPKRVKRLWGCLTPTPNCQLRRQRSAGQHAHLHRRLLHTVLL